MERGTRSLTLADLLPRAAQIYGDAPAIRFKEGDEWLSRSFVEVADLVRPLALGLVGLGVEKGDKVSILANTRPEWTYLPLRGAVYWGDRRADLPDQLPRGVPVRAGELR